jgi:hypothetical protein
MIQVILRSKTAHGYYGSLSLKKRRQWLYDFLHDLESTVSEQHIKNAYYQEFSLQPYAGFFLTFLLFEDHCEN